MKFYLSQGYFKLAHYIPGVPFGTVKVNPTPNPCTNAFCVNVTDSVSIHSMRIKLSSFENHRPFGFHDEIKYKIIFGVEKTD